MHYNTQLLAESETWTWLTNCNSWKEKPVSGELNCLLWTQNSTEVNISPGSISFPLVRSLEIFLIKYSKHRSAAAVRGLGGLKKCDFHFFLAFSFCPSLSFLRGKAETGVNLPLECVVQNLIWARLIPNYFLNQNKQGSSEEIHAFQMTQALWSLCLEIGYSVLKLLWSC